MHWPLWIYTEILEIVIQSIPFWLWNDIKFSLHIMCDALHRRRLSLKCTWTISTHPIWFLKGFRIFPEDLGVKQWWGSSFGVVSSLYQKALLEIYITDIKRQEQLALKYQNTFCRERTSGQKFINTFNHKPGCFSDLLLDSEAEAWPDYPQKKHFGGWNKLMKKKKKKKY